MNVWLRTALGSVSASDMTEVLGWTLVHSLWQIALLAACALCASRLLMHWTAVRYWMFVCTMMLSLGAPVTTWMLLQTADARVADVPHEFRAAATGRTDHQPDSGIEAQRIQQQVKLTDLRPSPSATLDEPAPALSQNSVPEGVGPSAIVLWRAAADGLRPWLSTLVAIWAVGVLAFAVRPVAGWLMVLRLRTVGVVAVDDAIEHMIARLKRTLAVRRSVQVFQSALVKTPIVVGCFANVILLPTNLISQLPTAQLEAILAHELAHVRRYDYWINLLQTIVETIFFYHPCIWWLSRRIRVERENCCDDLVVATLGDRLQYGRALLAIEEFRDAVPLLALAARNGSLLARIQRLSQTAPQRPRSIANGLSALMLTTVSIAVTIWLLTTVSAVTPLPSPGAQPESAADSTAGESPFRLPDHWIVCDLRFTEDGKELVTVSMQGGVRVRRWDVSNRSLLSEIQLISDRHARPVRQDTLQLSADARKVIAATDEYVGIWDVSNGELLKKFNIPSKEREYDSVRCLDCSSDLSVIVAGLGVSVSKTTLVYDGYAIVWDVETGQTKQLITHKHGFYFRDVSVSPDGLRFASCNEHGGGVSLWETNTGKHLRDFSAAIDRWSSPAPQRISNNMIDALAFSPSGTLLELSGTYGVRLVDSSTGEVRVSIDEPYTFHSGDTDLAFSVDGLKLARLGAGSVNRLGTADSNGYTVPIWSATTGEKLRELATKANCGAFSEDGTQLAIGTSDFYEAVAVWPLVGDSATSFGQSPTAYPRIDRVEENTHTRGKTAEEFVSRWKPVWGEPQHGLQYGIAFTAGTNKFRLGERVRMAAFVRNVSNRPQQVDFRPDMFGNTPQVVSGTGQLAELKTRPLLGTIAHYRDSLQPAECFGPLYLGFGLGENPRPGRQSWTPYWDQPVVGKNNLTHTIALQVADLDAGSDLANSAWTSGELSSGTLEFEVIDGGEATAAQNISPPNDAANGRAVGASNQRSAMASGEDRTSLPWRAVGRVTNAAGKPLRGVTVRAATGVGTLLGGASTITDADGRYDFRFGLGIAIGRGKDGKPSPQTQYALISAALDGHFEANFNRQGNGIASLEPVDASVAKQFGVEPNQVCLPGEPRQVDFVMLLAARVSGTLVNEAGQSLKDYSVMLTGDRLAPGASVLAQVQTDAEGRFEIISVPTTMPFQFQVRKPRSQLEPPWNDSWASAPIQFADPGENEFATRLVDSKPHSVKRFDARDFVLKIRGPGVHSKSALATAAKQNAFEFLSSVDTSAAASVELRADHVTANEWILELSNK